MTDEDGRELLTSDDLAHLRKELSTTLKTELFFGDNERLTLNKLPIGIPTIDIILNGGLAFDRISQVFGQFSAGKTVFAMLAMKAAQAEGLAVAFIDVEKTWTPEWAAQVGVDPTKVIVHRPTTGEQAFDMTVAMVKRHIGLIVIDSLGAMEAAAEQDQDEDDLLEHQHQGRQPKLIGRGLRAINSANEGTLIICVNQLRMNFTSYGNPESKPGGMALKHHIWQDIRIKRGAWIEEGTGKAKKRIGYHMIVQVEKNKQGEPFRQAEVPFYFTGEIDEVAAFVDYALELGVIVQRGASYRLRSDEEVKFIGKQKLCAAVRDDSDLRKLIETDVDTVPSVDL